MRRKLDFPKLSRSRPVYKISLEKRTLRNGSGSKMQRK